MSKETLSMVGMCVAAGALAVTMAIVGRATWLEAVITDANRRIMGSLF